MIITARNGLCTLMLLSIFGSAFGQDDNGGVKLGGRTFAITGEYLYTAPVGLPFKVGDTFQNCYTFQEDTTPGDGLESGIWNDPLFPDPGPPVPGTWIQHNINPLMHYTAFSDGGGGVTLVQNGWLQPAFAKRNVRLTAYSTVTLAGYGVVVEVLSKGYQVETCPYELPQPEGSAG